VEAEEKSIARQRLGEHVSATSLNDEIRLYNDDPRSVEFMYDYVTKLCRRQAEVILNHENPNVRAIGQGEPRHRKYKRLRLGGG
jgi:hypothetical protein